LVHTSPATTPEQQQQNKQLAELQQQAINLKREMLTARGRKGGLAVHRKPRGLAALTKKHRQLIAAAGGAKTLEKYGPEHYSKNGQIGAAAVLAKYGESFYSEIGSKAKRRKKREQQQQQPGSNQFLSNG
jgi:hypothetical protein